MPRYPPHGRAYPSSYKLSLTEQNNFVWISLEKAKAGRYDPFGAQRGSARRDRSSSYASKSGAVIHG